DLFPYERQFGYVSYVAAKGDKTGGALDQILEPLVEVCACNLLRQLTIRIGLELVHQDAEHAPAALVRPAARSLHHAQVSARADGVTALRKELPQAQGLSVLLAILAALRAAENGYDLFHEQLTASVCRASAGT